MGLDKKVFVFISVLMAIALNAEYYKECDFNGNGKIDTRSDIKAGKSSKEFVIRENRCKRKTSIKKSNENIEKSNENIEKIRIIEKLLQNK